jgi:hypothetical protein
LDRGVFDPHTARAVVKNHLSGRRNHTFLVLAMMIFEVSQREFVDAAAHPACSKAGTHFEDVAARSERLMS